jgi:hypothetical protein
MECWCGSFDRCELPWPDIYTLCFRINESHLLDLMITFQDIRLIDANGVNPGSVGWRHYSLDIA